MVGKQSFISCLLFACPCHEKCRGENRRGRVRVIAPPLEPQTPSAWLRSLRLRRAPTSIRTTDVAWATAVLDPSLALARERIGCAQERWEIDAHHTHLRRSGQLPRRKQPAVVRQERCGLLLAYALVQWWMPHSACEAPLDPDRLRVTPAVEIVDSACVACALSRVRRSLGCRRESGWICQTCHGLLHPVDDLLCMSRMLTSKRTWHDDALHRFGHMQPGATRRTPSSDAPPEYLRLPSVGGAAAACRGDGPLSARWDM
jgi:hypothetical protein